MLFEGDETGCCLSDPYESSFGCRWASGFEAGTFLAGLENCLFTEVDLPLQRPKRRVESYRETNTTCSHRSHPTLFFKKHSAQTSHRFTSFIAIRDKI